MFAVDKHFPERAQHQKQQPFKLLSLNGSLEIHPEIDEYLHLRHTKINMDNIHQFTRESIQKRKKKQVK